MNSYQMNTLNEKLVMPGFDLIKHDLKLGWTNQICPGVFYTQSNIKHKRLWLSPCQCMLVLIRKIGIFIFLWFFLHTELHPQPQQAPTINLMLAELKM